MKTSKILSMLIMALLLFVLPFCAIAENLTVYYDGLNYNIDTSTMTASVVNNRSTTSNRITIPASIKYNGETYDVTEIAPYAFQMCSELESISFPNTLRQIGSSSFSYCKKLTALTIPSSVELIDNQAFSNCENLSELIFENCPVRIVHHAFMFCKALTSLTIPKSVVEIGDSAFHVCTSLENVHILGSNTLLGNYIFDGSTLIKKVTMPGNKPLNDIFSNNPVEEIIISEGTTKITANAFLDCTTLEKVTLPESLKTIGTSAFDGCTALKEITIPAGVERISLCAFASSGLTDIYCEGLLAPMLDSTVGIFPRNAVIHAPEDGQEYTQENGWRNVSMPTPPIVETPTPTPFSVETPTPTPKPTVNATATPVPSAEPTAYPTIDPDTAVILNEMPKTDDDSHIGLWLLALIACGSVFVWMRRRTA